MSNAIKFFIILMLISSIFISVIFTAKKFIQKSEYDQYFHCDIFSQLNAFTAGANFYKHGFKKLFFLPINSQFFEVLQNDYRNTEILYTHYPPGPDIISGLFFKIGIKNFYRQKLFLLILNLANVFFIVFWFL